LANALLDRGDCHRRTGSVMFALAPGTQTCLDLMDDAVYLVDEADVTFWGLCPQCRPEAG
jgi:hypothetical protein